MVPVARFVGLVCLLAVPAAHAAAQTSVRGTVGVVRQSGIFGDDSPLSTSHQGMTFGVETRRAPREFSGLAFEIAVPVRSTDNPHFDESVQHIYLLAGGEFGRRTFARILGGGALGSWSGTRAESAFSLAPAAAIAVGHHIDVGTRLRITPEVVARGNIAGGVATWMMGVQVAVSRRP